MSNREEVGAVGRLASFTFLRRTNTLLGKGGKTTREREREKETQSKEEGEEERKRGRGRKLTIIGKS